MHARLVIFGVIAVTSVGLSPREAVATDKVALACIQAAEDGEAARNAGQLLHARELFAKCSAAECPTVLRKDCTSWVEDAEAQIPSIVLGANDGRGHDVVEARASVDGALVRERLDGIAVALNPGAHVVRFESAGLPPVEVQVVLRAGEKNRPVLAALAPPAPAPTASRASPPAVVSPEPHPHVPAGAWLLGAVSVAGFAVFGTLGAIGSSDASTLRATCAPGCSDAQVQAVRTKLLGADVGLGVGVVSLALATWIAIRGLSASRPASAWEIVVDPSPHAAGGGVRVRF